MIDIENFVVHRYTVKFKCGKYVGEINVSASDEKEAIEFAELVARPRWKLSQKVGVFEVIEVRQIG